MKSALLPLLALRATARAIPIFYSTGNPSSTEVNYQDTHYSISNSTLGEVPLVADLFARIPSPTPLVSGGLGIPSSFYLYQAWTAGTNLIAPFGQGQWISPWIPATNTNPWCSDLFPFTYNYQTIIGGSGSALFTGFFAADNFSEIFVNHLPTGFATPNTSVSIGALAPGTPFSLSLTAGDLVEFRTFNSNIAEKYLGYGNPSGLLVAVNSPAPLPDPIPVPDYASSALLLAISLFSLSILSALHLRLRLSQKRPT